ncbi:hypothetical protein SCA6_015488 [Theobroma cacao]
MLAFIHGRCEDLNKPLERTYRISKEKAKSLGVSFIPLECWSGNLPTSHNSDSIPSITKF